MVAVASNTPAAMPFLQLEFSALSPSDRTAKPSEQGWNPDYSGLHPAPQQEKMVKLFFARYFNLRPVDLAMCIGVDQSHGELSQAQFDTAKRQHTNN
jgi:hypothetical protein